MAPVDNEFRVLLMLGLHMGCNVSGSVQTSVVPSCQHLVCAFGANILSKGCASGPNPRHNPHGAEPSPAPEFPKHVLGLQHPLMLLHLRSYLDLVCSSPTLCICQLCENNGILKV